MMLPRRLLETVAPKREAPPERRPGEPAPAAVRVRPAVAIQAASVGRAAQVGVPAE
jgi:hypothetical protein